VVKKHSPTFKRACLSNVGKNIHEISEPEDFLKLAERMDSWALMVALMGEGQEIHLGEESGLAQWNDFVIGDAETMDSSLPGEGYRCFYEGGEAGEDLPLKTTDIQVGLFCVLIEDHPNFLF
jgi:hypothetical protein